MAFYHFSQNNSGGRLDNDPAFGIGRHVIIQATEKTIEARAAAIFAYPTRSGSCSCCGPRWGYHFEGSRRPSVYGAAVCLDVPAQDADVFVHYTDGTIRSGLVNLNR